MAKKAQQTKLTDFESNLLAACLAGKIIRNEFGPATQPAEIAAAMRSWLGIARTAEQGMTGGKKRA